MENSVKDVELVKPIPAPDPPPIYGPAPVEQPTVDPVPIGDTNEDIYGANLQDPNSEGEKAIVTEEVNSVHQFINDLDGLINDMDTFNNNSCYVIGEFGQAMLYSSDVFKSGFESLRDYAENNFLKAMSDVGQIKKNNKEINNIMKPIIGDVSEVQFDEEGSIILSSEELKKENSVAISNVEDLFKKNKSLKDRVELLSNEKINNNN